MDRLRAETRDEHAHIEARPFFAALAAGKLSLASYVGWLHIMSAIHEAFEQQMLCAQHDLLAELWDGSLRKLPLIERDLAALPSHEPPQSAMLRAQLVTQRIRRRAHDDPISLLGYLYVLEGSTLGGLVLQSQASRSLGLSASSGLAYLSSYEKATKAHWTEFSQRVNRAPLDPAAQARIVEAAREAFVGIDQIVEELYPLGAPPQRDLVRLLNPEAGTHAIPNDPREVEAALRAGERSWQQFPYYEWRYGQRGERFTRSDSAWLAALAEYDPPVVEQQILWLGRVLAARGMPQWMLELHLELLYEELSTAVPEKQPSYTALRLAAQSLREMRRRHIGDALFQSLTADFDQAVGPEWSARLPRTGGLLAAAVADERAGITNAVASIQAWMSDPSRFPPAWIEAVQHTLAAARAQAV
jgi:heme oxygenase